MFARLKKRFKKPQSHSRTPAQRMVTLKRADIYYLPIAKCGSTYLKNLFYYLDNGGEHYSGDDIHSIDDALLRADSKDTGKITASGYAFAVVRHPVDRFLSYYFDKVYGQGPRSFPHHQKYFTRELGLDLSSGIDVSGHRINCLLLIDWIKKNLAHKTEEPINPHWRRQTARLKRVAAFDLEYLTLDGLDWQLPLFVGGVIPDIRDAMAAVKARNKTDWPVDRAALLDEELTGKIEETYKNDLKIYVLANRKWQAWVQDDVAAENRKLRVISAGNLPLYSVTTPKVGCTYLKNLFYILEHGKAYNSPSLIHGSGENARQDLTKAELAAAVSFFVVRDPTDRFFSLYFDKIYGSGPQAFQWITKRLIEKRGFVAGPDVSLAQHQQNCMGLLGYLEHKFATQSPEQLNPHWRPQIIAAKRVLPFGLKPLLLENLEEQLRQIAGNRISNLNQAMARVPERNRTKRAYTNLEILTPKMAQRISTLYSDDQALYERVKSGWAKTGKPPEL